MDAALLFVAVFSAGALIYALLRSNGGASAESVFQIGTPHVSVHEESKTVSLNDLPPELRAQGEELAQLALKGKDGGSGLTEADKERMLELVRTLAAKAPVDKDAPAIAPDDPNAIRLLHVDTRTNVDVDS